MSLKPVSTSSAKDERKTKLDERISALIAVTFIVVTTVALTLTVVWWDWK